MSRKIEYVLFDMDGNHKCRKFAEILIQAGLLIDSEKIYSDVTSCVLIPCLLFLNHCRRNSRSVWEDNDLADKGRLYGQA